MKKLIYIFFFITGVASGQSDFLLASIQQAGGCENIYTVQNAINDCDEANSVTGIYRHAGSSVGTGTVTSTTSFTDTGTNSARFLHTGSTDQTLNFYIDLPVVNGTTYTVEVRVYRAAGSNNWFLRLDSGTGWAVTSSDRVTAITGGGFYETLIVTATADITGTAQITWNGSSGADGGDDNYWAYMIVSTS